MSPRGQVWFGLVGKVPLCFTRPDSGEAAVDAGGEMGTRSCRDITDSDHLEEEVALIDEADLGRGEGATGEDVVHYIGVVDSLWSGDIRSIEPELALDGEEEFANRQEPF